MSALNRRLCNQPLSHLSCQIFAFLEINLKIRIKPISVSHWLCRGWAIIDYNWQVLTFLSGSTFLYLNSSSDMENPVAHKYSQSLHLLVGG